MSVLKDILVAAGIGATGIGIYNVQNPSPVEKGIIDTVYDPWAQLKDATQFAVLDPQKPQNYLPRMLPGALELVAMYGLYQAGKKFKDGKK